MTRTGQAAIDAANAHVGHDMAAAGYCLQFTRECFDVAPLYGSAADAWNAARIRHHDRNVPPAVPVFFDSSSPHEHVCISTENGTYVSTFNAEVRKYGSLAQVEQTFGPLLGWTEDLNGVVVYAPTPDGGDDWLSYLSYEEQRRVLAWADQGQPQLGQIRSLIDQVKPNTDRLPTMNATLDRTSAQVDNNHNGILAILDALSAITNPSGRGVALAFLIVLVAAVVGVIVGILVAANVGAWTGAGILAAGLIGAVLQALRTRP